MTDFEAEKWSIEEARRITRSVLSGKRIRTWFFGSRATGRPRRFSDIDLALDAGAAPVDRALLAHLTAAFEESHIPFRVDIVDMASVSPAVRASIETEGQKWID